MNAFQKTFKMTVAVLTAAIAVAFVALPGARVETIRLPDTVFTSETVDAGKTGTNPKPQLP